MSDCIFCKIVQNQIPTDIIYENEEVIAFKDINPVAPFHCLVVTKKHYDSIVTVDPKVMEQVTVAIQEIVKENALNLDGFRVVNNCGRFGQQTVNHIHFHVIGKRQFQWPPG